MAWSAPASYLQEQWYRSVDNRVSNHNVVTTWQVDGKVDTGALIEAVAELGARHDVLRTELAADGDGVRQVVWPWPKLDLARVGLSRSSVLPEEVEGLIVSDAARGFRLDARPLWRVLIVRLSDRQHVIGMTFSHAISDGWSTSVAQQDLAWLYEELVTGRASRLTELEIDFGDYAAWERRLRVPAVEAEWRERLSSFVGPAPLPTTGGRPAGAGAFEMVALPLPEVGPECGSELTRIAKEKRAKLGSSLMAAVGMALSQHLDGSIIIGWLYANRDRDEVQPVIGPVFDYLPICLDLSGGPTFLDLVGQARDALEYAKERRLPVGLVEERVLEAPATGRLFDVVVELIPDRGLPVRAIAGPEGATMQWSPYSVDLSSVRQTGDRRTVATAPLAYIVHEGESGSLAGELYANHREFDWATLEGLAGEFVDTLKRVSGDPLVRVR